MTMMRSHFVPIKILLGLVVLMTASAIYAADKKPHFSKAPLSGEQVYKAVCATCHAHGLAGAPRTGNRQAWAPLIAEGYDDLVGSSLTGVRMMPPKGGAPELYDIEVARAVVYMVKLSGGQFPEPNEANVAAARQDGERRHLERLKKAAASRQ
jgi:cytochrome c5